MALPGAGGGSGMTIAGVPLSPEVSAIVLVYFVQGILGLSRLAKDYFVKDELHLSPAEASLIFSASSIPWLIKPLWGFISDSVPLFGYRRKSYLVLCGALGAAAGFALCTVVTDVPGGGRGGGRTTPRTHALATQSLVCIRVYSFNRFFARSDRLYTAASKLGYSS